MLEQQFSSANQISSLGGWFGNVDGSAGILGCAAGGVFGGNGVLGGLFGVGASLPLDLLFAIQAGGTNTATQTWGSIHIPNWMPNFGGLFGVIQRWAESQG
jgi:hypothetical protein